MRGDAARVIENVAASVADGARVDWDRAGAQVSGRELRIMKHLRLIDSLAEVYRTLPSFAADDGSGANHRPDYPEGPRWGRLILFDRIGRGTSADVFRAWDAELQREVALKLLHDDGVTGEARANARLLQEARRLARIRHPHVAHVYGAERHEERIGLWMELVRGRSLDAIVREDGPLAVNEATHIGIDLCSALAAVHGAGLLHRDVKAQNVIREDDGRTVLMDFGTGEEIEDRTPRLAGTPLYLAPEILKHRPASVQSDVYGVGVLLFYLVTGEFPVKGDSMEGLAEAHREGRARNLREVRPDVPAALARVVDRALAPEPSRRYASASAMEAALRQTLDVAPGRRTAAGLQWGLIATTTAATIVALVATLYGRPPSRSSSSSFTSLAVLPLRLVSAEAEAPYLADGLTDQLITTLSEIHSLRVTALTSVSRFKGSTASAAEIARELGVDGIIEGTVAVQAGVGGQPPRARVNVRVIKAGTDLDIWSGSLERPFGDMLALESELARTITREVRGVLTPNETAHLRQARPTDPDAERAYFEGRAHLGQLASRAELALGAFKRALAIDPNHAGAHAGAARSYIALGFDRAISQPEARASALAEASRALELDEGSAEAHGALADIKFFYDWDWDGAEREYRRAIDLGPSASEIRSQYAQFLAALSRPREAEAETSNALTLNPLSGEAALTRALILYYARRYDEALNAVDHAAQLDPSLATTEFLRGRIYDAQRRYAEAADATDRAIRRASTVALGWRVQALRLKALSGDLADARSGFAKLVGQSTAAHLGSSPHAAYLHLSLGQPEEALSALEHAVSQRDPGVLWMAVDPRLDPLRKMPAFTALLHRVGLR